MISIPRPRPVDRPEETRHAPWSTISIQTASASVQKVNSTVSPGVGVR